LAEHEEAAIASVKLEATISEINEWAKKLRSTVKQNKSTHISFTLRSQTCPALQKVSVALPQKKKVKYMRMHLDRRLTWSKRIKAQRNQLNLKAKHMH
jgi:hypothetical protein